MEIERALKYMRMKDFDKAIEALKAFEKKDQHLKAMAATNLSFIYFLEGDLRAAERYADLAYEQDRYNARALVNKGTDSNGAESPRSSRELRPLTRPIDLRHT